MKKIINYLILCIFVLSIVTAVIVGFRFSIFKEDGVQSFAGYTKLDFSEKVYFIDADTKEVSGSGTFTIYGIIAPEKSNKESSLFKGHLNVSTYPLTMEESYNGYFGSASGKMLSLAAADRNTDSTWYWLIMSNDDPSIYAVQIHMPDGSNVTAYPGETEAEALENCDRYWDWFRG